MPTIDTFDTLRLTAERLCAAHLDDLCRMHRDERVMATLAGVWPDDQTRRFLEGEIAHWAQHGFGLWMFRDRVDGSFAGRAGLRRVHVCGRDEVELAYAVMAEYWGRGLATEMGAACVRLGFEEIGLPEIVAYTMVSNAASRGVMEKLGFQYERDFTHADLPHALYRLRRGDSTANA